MGILGWIVFGLVVGALAKFVMPGKDPGGIIVTILLGIVGAVVGGFLGRAARPLPGGRAGRLHRRADRRDSPALDLPKNSKIEALTPPDARGRAADLRQ